MPQPARGKALEPWPGYAKQTPEDRQERLRFKVSEARMRGDLLYAKALCVAVAATEQIARGEDARGALETEAIKSAGTIDTYAKSLFKDAGGWTPN
jgi:hypothetical protein